MKKFFATYGWCMFVGFCLGALFDVQLWDWRWWVFFVPLTILVEIKSQHDVKESKEKQNDR